MSLAEQLKLEDEINSFELKITSITQNPEGTQVNATGTVGRYGKVWLTYNFVPNSTQENMGSFIGIGRAVTEDGVQNEGRRRGVYIGNSVTGTVYSLDDVSDGATNFCIEKWDMSKETIQLQFSAIEK